ncbi:MAG: hypothetical protein G3M78_03725 [Candidatus Nitrohelix vancouverensis]|uniref:Alkaline phytoceramidase n=1 Tax=Candidatus Nitrohelix vancouverensis TaxID=2705534 RepID=A0A7T0G2Q5_9BACT|nr:MAG: hypothetical protein G3M78_03725 [Candidatus Nitrohelix vancouverensis]
MKHERPQHKADGKTRALIALFVAGGLSVFFLDPIAQNPLWSQFADHRTLFGIPNAIDVLSNFPFLVIGAMGLRFIMNLSEKDQAFEFSIERRAALCFFGGVFLTAFGSAWFHLDPGNDRLVWDRLPMTLAFSGVVCLLIADRTDPRTGASLLPPLALLGIFSVIWWRWSESQGQGDLRLYFYIQFAPMLMIPILLTLFPARYTKSSGYLWLLIWYALAKYCEVMDASIYDSSSNGISGHSLKHLLAACGVLHVLHMLRTRSALKIEPNKNNLLSL